MAVILFMLLILLIVYTKSAAYHYDEDFPSYPAPNYEINRYPNLNEFPNEWYYYLEKYFPFYNKLNANDKELFRTKMVKFVNYIDFFPIDFQMLDRDYVYIAGSAVMPILYNDDWFYPNLRRIIIHNKTHLGIFKADDGSQQYTVGFYDIGTDPYSIHLSRNQIWYDFIYDTASNVALHEFIHFIDFADKKMDGIPSVLIDKKYIEPWLDVMLHEIKNVLQSNSVMSSYDTQNRAEFLSSISETYFKNPEIIEKNHPKLFELLEKFYNKK